MPPVSDLRYTDQARKPFGPAGFGVAQPAQAAEVAGSRQPRTGGPVTVALTGVDRTKTLPSATCREVSISPPPGTSWLGPPTAANGWPGQAARVAMSRHRIWPVV